MGTDTRPGGGGGFGSAIPGPGGTQDVNILEIAGNAVATTGINGTMPTEGTQAAETAVDDGSFPVQVGALVRAVLTSITDDYITKILADTYGRLYVRNLGADVLLDAQKTAEIAPTQSDRDEAPQTLANVSNIAVAATPYPSTAGVEIGNRSFLSFQIRMRDGKFDFQVSVDGTNWGTAVSKSLVWNEQGASGYDSTTGFSEPDVAIVDFFLDWERCGHRYIRVLFTPNNATSSFVCYLVQRAL